MFKVTIEDSFAAAHLLENYKGKCENLHGHNWKIRVTVETDKLDDIGLAIDFHDLQKITRTTLDLLDHKNLSELEFFSTINPSSENIARFIFNNIKKNIPDQVRLTEVEVLESDNCSIKYSE
ncbi:6-carboxytetrahydropterin synthase QueD [candidate division KSB1 bacterium]